MLGGLRLLVMFLVKHNVVNGSVIMHCHLIY